VSVRNSFVIPYADMYIESLQIGCFEIARMNLSLHAEFIGRLYRRQARASCLIQSFLWHLWVLPFLACQFESLGSSMSVCT
jgi:hypothetical protein